MDIAGDISTLTSIKSLHFISYHSYHPLGFAYFPDGAHADADELEPSIVPPGSSSECDKNMTCAAPMYYVDGEYKGTYSNNEDLLAVTSDEDNFGLDDYEPLFFHPLPEWIGYGEMSVFLKIDDDTDYTKDIFYFCHVSVHISISSITLTLESISLMHECYFTLFVDSSIHDWPHQAS